MYRDDLNAGKQVVFRGHSRQRGVALVVGLVFLLITTLMAVTAMSGVVMQERMAGNSRNVSIATGGSESALRAAEVYLMNLISRGDQVMGNCDGSLDGVYNRDDMACGSFTAVEQFRSATSWLSSTPGARNYPGSLIGADELSDPDGAGMARRPQFLIEHMGDLNPPVGEWGRGGTYAGGTTGGDAMPARAYRLSSRSTGSSVTVVRGSESTFAAFVGGGLGGLCPDGVTPLPSGPDDPPCPI